MKKTKQSVNNLWEIKSPNRQAEKAFKEKRGCI